MDKGIIVSIQGYQKRTMEELAVEAVNGGAVALRIDKPLSLPQFERKIPIIGLNKIIVPDPKKQAYITASIDQINMVSKWSDFVAIDYRELNPDLKELSEHCQANKIKVVADIGSFIDYMNIKDKGYYYTYIATTFSVLRCYHIADLKLLKKIYETGERNLIGEGNYKTREDVKNAYQIGVNNVCIGSAISNVYKLTRKYTSVTI